MGMVYGYSNYPVALLNTSIRYQGELNTLADILEGKLLGNGRKNHLKQRDVINGRARKALELLDRITSDDWWTRAWTFQEDYRASVKMVLLVPCDRAVSAIGRNSRMIRLFEDLDDELCIKSADFRKQSTRFCLAFQKVCDWQQRETCKRILKQAGKYTVLLRRQQGYAPIDNDEIAEKLWSTRYDWNDPNLHESMTFNSSTISFVTRWMGQGNSSKIYHAAARCC